MRDNSMTDTHRQTGRNAGRDGELVLGDDCVAPEQTVGRETGFSRSDDSSIGNDVNEGLNLLF